MSNQKKKIIISPYGNKLVNLVVSGDSREELIAHAATYPSIQISQRSICDLELLATGGFSPLDRFMSRSDYQRVLTEMRLENGLLFPIPITLTINEEELPTHAEWLALRDAHNNLIAIMRIEEFYSWDPLIEARLAYGTTDHRHPMVSEMIRWGNFCISGELKVIKLPKYTNFTELRRTPLKVRELLNEMGNTNVVAFQTRNPIYRIDEELTKRVAEKVDGGLLIHPVVGMAKLGDVDQYTRVRIYKALYDKYYDHHNTVLNLLSLAIRMAGPREIIWHAIIQRNFGANYLIVERDHARSGNNSQGKPFYDPYETQEFMRLCEEEIGVGIVSFQELSHFVGEDKYFEPEKAPKNTKIYEVSETQIREDYLAKGKLLPKGIARKETAEILQQAYPPRHQSGFVLWFTGLSGSGKSTTAVALTSLLLERGRSITVLDGDVVRTHLSKGLGFSREDRDTNILRIGFVAGEIARAGGAVITAAVSPYRKTRNEARKMVGDNFIEVYVDTPLVVCEARDTKGLYAKARRGEIKGFTGIDDPYEEPIDPEIILNTVDHTPGDNALKIVTWLTKRGYILPVSNDNRKYEK